MKVLFFSDIHGVPRTLEQLLTHAESLQAERLVLLGDALYHGPRNGVPGFYDPLRVAELLNAHKSEIMAVRGNCDAEADQMMLNFPILADYSEFIVDGTRFFLTHGHLWNANCLPPISEGTVLANGHTHIPELRRLPNNIIILNPGSISLPKRAAPQTFAFYEDATLTIRRLDDGSVLNILNILNL